MTVVNEKILISSKGFSDLIDLTLKIQNVVAASKCENGIINVTVCASTASILTLEYEPGLVRDLPKLFENLVPINQLYEHDLSWHDGNGYAHLRAAMLGNNIALPIIDGKIELNTWQRIVLIDFDNKTSTREIVASIVF